VKVVVFGAGRRVKGAVLPALRCLENRFSVAAVVSRKAHELVVGDRRLMTCANLDEIDFAGVGLIVIAVTTTEVPRLLARLATKPVRDAVVLLDTPVLPPTRIAAARHLRAFKRVLVSEDTLALPPFRLARTLLDSGAIGTLRRIYFFHNGYKYHALASIKLLAGSSIRSITSRRYGGKLCQKTIELENGVRALLYEPRDYELGKFRLEGERGCIADYDHPKCRRIGYVVERGIYRGLTLDGAPVPQTELDSAYVANVGADLFDASLMSSMKLRGLVDVLAASVAEHSPLHYQPFEAITDNVAIELSDRFGFARPSGIETGLSRIARTLGWSAG
jgi:hypothetical protein